MASWHENAFRIIGPRWITFTRIAELGCFPFCWAEQDLERTNIQVGGDLGRHKAPVLAPWGTSQISVVGSAWLSDILNELEIFSRKHAKQYAPDFWLWTVVDNASFMVSCSWYDAMFQSKYHEICKMHIIYIPVFHCAGAATTISLLSSQNSGPQKSMISSGHVGYYFAWLIWEMYICIYDLYALGHVVRLCYIWAINQCIFSPEWF